MGKGKKKTKGKKRGGNKVNDTGLGDTSTWQATPEQLERARLAATNRAEDPLKNWIRPKNEECPICMLPLPFSPSENKYWYCCGKTDVGAA